MMILLGHNYIVDMWSEHLQLKQETLGSIPGDYPGFFCFVFFQLAY